MGLCETNQVVSWTFTAFLEWSAAPCRSMSTFHSSKQRNKTSTQPRRLGLLGGGCICPPSQRQASPPPPRVALPKISKKKIMEYFSEILKVLSPKFYEIRSRFHENLVIELLIPPKSAQYSPDLHVKQANKYIGPQNHILVTKFVYIPSSEESFWIFWGREKGNPSSCMRVKERTRKIFAVQKENYHKAIKKIDMEISY